MAIDYLAVLDDLESRRRKLDAAISAIEEILGQERDLKDDEPVAVASPAMGQYQNLTHMEAIEACVKEHGPQTAAALTKLLRDRGKGVESKSFYNTVHKYLVKGRESGKLVKIGKKWTLASDSNSDVPEARKEAQEKTNGSTLISSIQELFTDDPKRSWTAMQIEQALKEAQFKFKGKDSRMSVNLSLKRLRERRLVKVTRKGKGRAPNLYRAVEQAIKG